MNKNSIVTVLSGLVSSFVGSSYDGVWVTGECFASLCCWHCGRYSYDEHEDGTSYVHLKDGRAVGVCSGHCASAVFEEDMADWFDWQPLAAVTNMVCYHGCSACGSCEADLYIHLDGGYGSPVDGGALFCSPACVRTFFNRHTYIGTLSAWELRELSDERYGHYDDPSLRTRDRRYQR